MIGFGLCVERNVKCLGFTLVVGLGNKPWVRICVVGQVMCKGG